MIKQRLAGCFEFIQVNNAAGPAIDMGTPVTGTPFLHELERPVGVVFGVERRFRVLRAALHASVEAKGEVKCRLVFDVVRR